MLGLVALSSWINISVDLLIRLAVFVSAVFECGVGDSTLQLYGAYRILYGPDMASIRAS